MYFDKELQMFPTVHHQESQHVYTAIHASYVDCLLTVNITSMYCCVYSVETPDDGQ